MPYDPAIHHRHSIRLRGYDYAQAGAYFVNIVTQGRECLFGAVTPDGEIVLNDAGRMIEHWWRELGAKYPHVITDAFVVMPNHFHGIVVIAAAHIVGAAVGGDLCVAPEFASDAPVALDAHAEPGAGGEPGAHTGAPVPGAMRAVGADLCVAPEFASGAPVALDAHAEPGAGGEPGAHTGAPLPGAMRAVGADLCVAPEFASDAHTDSGAGGEPGAHIEPGAHPGAPLPEIVQWFKTMTTNEYIRGVKTMGWQPFPGRLWQRNYYEHIIRDEAGLDRIRTYIANNPTQWALDDENPARGKP